MPAKLVVIGDSVSEGFLNGSISKTHLSFPALIAECLRDCDFHIPDFSGADGLPLNLEALLNYLEAQFGSCLFQANPELLQLAIGQFMDIVEDYWERGEGTLPSATGPLHRNLSVWGFQLPDCDTLSDEVVQQFIPPAEDDPVEQQPEFALYRTARRTLNPSQTRQYQSLAQLGVAQKIAEADGIDNLIFWLGSNHCLQTMVNLNVEWSTEETASQPLHLRTATLWRPEHFKPVLRRVAKKVAALGAENVFIGNVPHVTIPPVSRGVTPGAAPGEGQDADGYFEYYTHFWIWDSEFDPEQHPHLTRSQVKKIDAVVDEYNFLIQVEANRYGWHLVDMANSLDKLAFRRQQGASRYTFPSELVAALRANPRTNNRVTADDEVLLDTRYFRLDPEPKTPDNIYKGGLFSLDGTHPTTLGYGIIAHEFLQAMEKVWCAKGQSPLLKPLDWEKIVASDSLLTEPPGSLAEPRSLFSVLFNQPAAPETTSLRGLGIPKLNQFRPKVTVQRKLEKRGAEDQSGSSGIRRKDGRARKKFHTQEERSKTIGIANIFMP